MATATESSTWNGLVLRTGTDGDACAVAALHAGQIAEGFLTFLGPAFLRRLYRRVARTSESFLLVVEDGATTVGFLAGSTDVAALYRAFLWHDGPAVLVTCSGRLLRSWRRVIETLRHGARGDGEGAELLAIAVDPAARGRGSEHSWLRRFSPRSAGGDRRPPTWWSRRKTRLPLLSIGEPDLPRWIDSNCMPAPSHSSCSG